MIVTEQQAREQEHVVRGSNGRLYARRFDHDEAIHRHAAGESVRALAAEYGVTETAVWYVVTPGMKARNVALHRSWRTGTCERCGGPAMRLVAGKKEHNRDGRILCNPCRGVVSRKPIRFGDGVVKVHCGHCDTWKALDEFSPRVARALAEGEAPRCRCRACETAERRRYREEHKVPCVGCGALCLPPSEKGARGADVPRCRSCFIDSLRKPGAETLEAVSPTRETGS